VGSAAPVGQVGVSTQGERFHQEGEAEVPGQPHQSLASGGVPARPGTKSAEKQLLVEEWHHMEGCVEVDSMDGSCPCKCPTRTPPPPAPDQCPFEPVAANVEKI
jgi:hypothetical protein